MKKSVAGLVERGIAGRLSDDGVMTKYVKKSLHLFRKLDSWCFDEALIETWLADGMHTFRVIDTEGRICYTVGARDFMKHSVGIEYGTDGPQLALPRAYWITQEEE